MIILISTECFDGQLMFKATWKDGPAKAVALGMTVELAMGLLIASQAVKIYSSDSIRCELTSKAVDYRLALEN